MDDRLREIEERLAKASPAPWRTYDNINGTILMVPPGSDANWGFVPKPQQHADMEFCAHSREDIPWLIQQLRLLRVLANGCPKHPSYRAKRKVNTICETCNAMWEARAALGGK